MKLTKMDPKGLRCEGLMLTSFCGCGDVTHSQYVFHANGIVRREEGILFYHTSYQKGFLLVHSKEGVV